MPTQTTSERTKYDAPNFLYLLADALTDEQVKLLKATINQE